MFRIAALFAFVSLLVAGGAGGAAAYTDRYGESSGLPPITYEEVVGQPNAAAGYSIVAIAAGAVGGVVAVNAILPMLGYSTVSAALAGAPVTGATLEAALATSRLVAVGGAAAGALVGQWLYAGWGN